MRDPSESNYELFDDLILTTTPKRGGIKGDPKRVIFSAKF